MHRVGVVLLALVACKAESPRGKTCAEDQDCGPGYDCYRKVCTQVCTQDSECSDGVKCVRYRCAPDSEATPPGVGTPPLPDATITELRAIRRELELIRRALTFEKMATDTNVSALHLPR